MSLELEAMETLKITSRTFYIPISRLPSSLLEAVSSAYLCLRAIDEIEDHPQLDNPTKAMLLHAISLSLQAVIEDRICDNLALIMDSNHYNLPEVSIRLVDWLSIAPGTIVHRICDATASMADRMAYWAENGWQVHTVADLDRYTFGVSGAVGLLLSDLWAWYDGTQTSRCNAIGFGRGLQAVNILRNRSEDLSRGVDFFPDGWQQDQLFKYCRQKLALADAYIDDLPQGPALDFCTIPLTLAYATLDALERGEPKLTRREVLRLVKPKPSLV
jgi:farnesyl-diphosphate farnesyltransferase